MPHLPGEASSRGRRSGSRGGREERRSRSRRDRRRRSSSERSRSRSRRPRDEELYAVDLLPGKRRSPYSKFDIVVGEDDSAGEPRSIQHVCARPEEGYVIRVSNRSRRHIACAVAVDGENALLKDGSLIVAPDDSRELPGFLVSKNFIGNEYVKEYRDFKFGKPKVVEAPAAGGQAAVAPGEFKSYGAVTCEVYEAVLDEEVSVDQQLHGQTTHYRGAGLHGSNEERKIPEGKKTHLMYSSVTVHGGRSSIMNSTAGRWWVRGKNKIRSLEVRYREPHSLMLLGVEPTKLGLAVSRCKDEDSAKKEDWDGKDEKKEEKEGLGKAGVISVCDLTADDEGEGNWSIHERPAQAEPVDT
eukprot:TRINITY_DN30974_c0_g1_i1.p1 TRINITY_DN30974_c0_g1~~TRINITY_DN30974_c0_g1_i1.p1  ORF type:complete len:356 (-),score=82.88 TRINITY_DN30974_c0_g1_i1:291-1358(-)